MSTALQTVSVQLLLNVRKKKQGQLTSKGFSLVKRVQEQRNDIQIFFRHINE